MEASSPHTILPTAPTTPALAHHRRPRRARVTHAPLLSFIPHILFPSLPWSSSSSSSSSSWTTLSNDVLAVVVVVAFDGSSSSSGFLVNVVDNGAALRSRLDGRAHCQDPENARYPMTATHSAGGALTGGQRRVNYRDAASQANGASQRQAHGVWMPGWWNEGVGKRDATMTMPMVRWECGVRSDTSKTTSGSDGYSTLRSLQVGRVG
ncbi:hypothetical protein DFP72DRAFT_1069142 [Ephemerocybe angulata]|uniref:Uncharacterized protein n=1 Tax=Ephemerocybe angulata TaxID=980116 RepID=A0A8H6HVF4_9AGAR|nr:hypothetical protein DFP72DRAFT_1069142 [Tulosesus angulatus]